MNECVECGKEYEAKRATSKYCSPKCRKLAFQADAKVSVPDEKQVSVPRTIIDACGNEHPIDFEGRRQTYELLESWAKGEGTAYQQQLGLLNRAYAIVKSKADLNHYLGVV